MGDFSQFISNQEQLRDVTTGEVRQNPNLFGNPYRKIDKKKCSNSVPSSVDECFNILAPNEYNRVLTLLADDYSLFSFGEISQKSLSTPLSSRKTTRTDRSSRGNTMRALRKGRTAIDQPEEKEEISPEAESPRESDAIEHIDFVLPGSRKIHIYTYFLLIWRKLCDFDRVRFDEKTKEMIRHEVKSRLNEQEMEVLIKYIERRSVELL